MRVAENEEEELAAQHKQLAAEIPNVAIPGQVKPAWEQISENLEQLLTPKEEEQNQ